jgi:glutathione synthase/RimK-type ligase-like ATP-grasp enzyme
MNFYCINSQGRNPKTLSLLKAACKKQGATFIELDPKKPLDTTKKLTGCVYRVSCTQKAKNLEIFCMKKGLKSIQKTSQSYKEDSTVIKAWKSNNVLTPPYVIQPSLSSIPNLTKKLGTPIVVKIDGSYGGQHTHRFYSEKQLLLFLEKAYAKNETSIVKKFIRPALPATSYRAICIGSKIICTYKNSSQNKRDFRSNATKKGRSRTQVSFSDADLARILKAHKVLPVRVSALDFIQTKKGELYFLEANAPFDFTSVVQDFSLPIHDYIVEYLTSL